jgi:hypothetical protein
MEESFKKTLEAIASGPKSKALGALDSVPSRSLPRQQVPTAAHKFWDKPTTISALVILATLTAGVYGLAVLLDRTLTPQTLQALPVKLAVSATILVGGILLYMIKVSSGQFLYGLAEIAVGLVANWRSLDSLARLLADPKGADPLYARVAVLAGGLYLIGRGIANFVEGMKRLTEKRKRPQSASAT